MYELRAAGLEDARKECVEHLFEDLTRDIAKRGSKFIVRAGVDIHEIPVRNGFSLGDFLWHAADAYSAFRWNGDFEAAGIVLEMEFEEDEASIGKLIIEDDVFGDEWHVRRGSWVIYNRQGYAVLPNRVFQSVFEPVNE